MKKSLQFLTGCVILCISGITILHGQTVVLSENFSGFTTGTHTTPSTSDASSSFDSKMQIPGWSGSRIYSAGGEIKAGTETIPGWIETPAIDLSGNNGQFTVKFDISRWPGDATTVQVSMNGAILGNSLAPNDNFESVQISCNGGTGSSKIKIQALTRRFFLDNFSVISDNIITGLKETEENDINIKIYPVPVNKILFINNIQNFDKIEIFDITGKIIRMIEVNLRNEIKVDFEGTKNGTYFIRFCSENKLIVKRFIKL